LGERCWSTKELVTEKSKLLREPIKIQNYRAQSLKVATVSIANLFDSAALPLVLLAAALDVAANMLLVRSDSFRRRFTGLLALALVGLAFYCLSLAVCHMDLAVAYAMWGGFGVLGTSLGGWILLRQKLRASALAGIALLVCGMVLLHSS